jgi:hypothetical protein
MNESHNVFVYWILGTFNNKLEALTLSVGMMRTFEYAGSAISSALGATSRVSPMTNLVVSLVVYFICIPSTSLLVLEVPEYAVDGLKPAGDANMST